MTIAPPLREATLEFGTWDIMFNGARERNLVSAAWRLVLSMPFGHILHRWGARQDGRRAPQHETREPLNFLVSCFYLLNE